MYDRISFIFSRRNVFVAFVVFILSLIAINLAATHFFNETGGYGILDLGGGANIFDDRGSYTPERAYTLIEHYGREGIYRYYLMLIADIFFPATFGFFAFLAITRSIRQIMPPNKSWPYWFTLIPIAYTLTDWSENIGILTMLLNYPVELHQVATVTNIIRGLKGVLAGTSLILVLATCMFAFWKIRTAMR